MYGRPELRLELRLLDGFYRVLGGGDTDSSLYCRRPNDTVCALALKGGAREEETDLQI